MHREQPYQPSYDPNISRLFFAICLILPVSILFAILFYPAPFHLWRDAFSQLGETVTPYGDPNVVSRLIFSAGWIASGLLMAMIALRYASRCGLRLRGIKSGLALLGAAGFFVAITPNNLNHLVHSVGMGMEVGVMYSFSMILLFELRPRMSRFVFYANTAVLHLVVVSYAVTFFTNSDYKQVAQKFCLLGLLLVMERMATIAPEGFEWRSVLAALRRSSK